MGEEQNGDPKDTKLLILQQLILSLKAELDAVRAEQNANMDELWTLKLRVRALEDNASLRPKRSVSF